ncbi:unnamed protein product, partial [Mesorhabditis spiculigera]
MGLKLLLGAILLASVAFGDNRIGRSVGAHAWDKLLRAQLSKQGHDIKDTISESTRKVAVILFDLQLVDRTSLNSGERARIFEDSARRIVEQFTKLPPDVDALIKKHCGGIATLQRKDQFLDSWCHIATRMLEVENVDELPYKMANWTKKFPHDMNTVMVQKRCEHDNFPKEPYFITFCDNLDNSTIIYPDFISDVGIDLENLVENGRLQTMDDTIMVANKLLEDLAKKLANRG